MIKYILKRLLIMIPIALIISMMLFFSLHLMPGDPIDSLVNCSINPDITELECESLKANTSELYGLDKHPIIQYFTWVSNVLKFDFGYSVVRNEPVWDLMLPRIQNSMFLNVFVLIISFSLSIPIGIISAIKKYSFFDNFWLVFTLVAMSLPTFFFASVLIKTLAVEMGWFEISAAVGSLSDYGNNFLVYVQYIYRHFTLPILVMTIGSLAGVIRYVRSSMLEVLGQDYIRTARSKGLKEKDVVVKHAFRNTLIPVVTIFAGSIPALFAGSLIIEQIFNYPGIGKLLYESTLIKLDFPVIMASNLFYTMLGLMANLVMDVTYAFVDPRVKVGY